ncbi:MAG: hypothetical protein JST62_12790 [Bacteroidetes bacterium]|nr:hypothetical protein [Bacteroidota bacterium]
MLGQSFKKQFDLEKDDYKKIEIKKTFAEFMVKMDSLQNVEFINSLIRVKNQEALFPKQETDTKQSFVHEGNKLPQNEKPATYPGGLNEMRKEVVNLLYIDGSPATKELKTDVAFIVEKDGEITHVEAFGDNPTFNRQAEIAMYLLPKKFSPAVINNNLVRYRFKMPLTMKFD